MGLRFDTIEKQPGGAAIITNQNITKTVVIEVAKGCTSSDFEVIT